MPQVMITFYIVLKISALFAVLLLPLIGPKKQKASILQEISNLFVNENGYLETLTGHDLNHRSTR